MLEGEPMPPLVGGAVALDFCNTWAGWGERPDPRSDWVATYDRLALWAQWSGVVDAGIAGRVRRAAARDREGAEDVMRQIRTLRTAVHTCVLEPQRSGAVALLTGVARRAIAHARLVPGAAPHWEVPPSAGLGTPLHRLALACAEFLTRTDLGSVRACPGKQCGWLFLDSRGRRRWCEMATCGNRAKARAHAARVRARSG